MRLGGLCLIIPWILCVDAPTAAAQLKQETVEQALRKLVPASATCTRESPGSNCMNYPEPFIIAKWDGGTGISISVSISSVPLVNHPFGPRILEFFQLLSIGSDAIFKECWNRSIAYAIALSRLGHYDLPPKAPDPIRASDGYEIGCSAGRLERNQTMSVWAQKVKSNRF